MNPGPRLPQHLLVQLLQLGTGIGTEFVRDHLTGLGVGLQGLGQPARAVEGTHEQRPQPLPERVLGQEAAQFRDHLGLPPAAEIGIDAQLQGGDPGLLQSARRGTHQVRVGDVGQRPAPLPQVESLDEETRGPLAIPG